MKILTSYFYQLRFFKPYMIPLSTAIFDPKWYHDGYDKSYYFKDKRGVYNGLRAEPFVPVQESDGECRGKEYCKDIIGNCKFLNNYYEQLKRLDFQEMLARFQNLGDKIKKYEGFEEEPIMILMVYETSENSCSERKVIHQWFKDNNYPIEEFNKINFN